MKRLLLIAVILFAWPVAAQWTPAQQAACAAEGGCLTMTREALVRALAEAHEMGREAVSKQRQRSCWRDA